VISVEDEFGGEKVALELASSPNTAEGFFLESVEFLFAVGEGTGGVANDAF
jgi:hypothetical protein